MYYQQVDLNQMPRTMHNIHQTLPNLSYHVSQAQQAQQHIPHQYHLQQQISVIQQFQAFQLQQQQQLQEQEQQQQQNHLQEHHQLHHHLSPQLQHQHEQQTQQNNNNGKITRVGRASRTGKPKRVRTIFTPDQLRRLEAFFSDKSYLVAGDRNQLAEELCLTEAQVKVWFQNRRIKARRLKPGDPTPVPQ